MSLVLLVPLMLLGCDATPRDFRETLYVFGTLVEIDIRAADPDAAQEAIAEITDQFRRMHRDWHAWEPGQLSDLNQSIAAEEPFLASEFLLPLIHQARRLETISGGLFNPAIGGIVRLWGFHQDIPPEGRPLPGEDQITAWQGFAPSTSDLKLRGNRVTSTNPMVSLDFGGFAKGEAVARAAAILKRFGIERAVINAGGGLLVIGEPADRPWRVGIRHPGDFGLLGAIELSDGEALMTSGNYERFREVDGVIYAHIIDPRTARPVPHVASVSVIHPDPALADAASTALTVAGPDHWRALAATMGVRHVLFVTADGKIDGTEDMLRRLELNAPAN